MTTTEILAAGEERQSLKAAAESGKQSLANVARDDNGGPST